VEFRLNEAIGSEIAPQKFLGGVQFLSRPGKVRSILMSVYVSESVCLSVCLSVIMDISRTARQNFIKSSVHVVCGRGSVHLWRRCNTLYISGFVHDVTFSYDRPYGGDASTAASQRCRVRPDTPAAWYWLRPLLDDGERDTTR